MTVYEDPRGVTVVTKRGGAGICFYVEHGVDTGTYSNAAGTPLAFHYKLLEAQLKLQDSVQIQGSVGPFNLNYDTSKGVGFSVSPTLPQPNVQFPAQPALIPQNDLSVQFPVPANLNLNGPTMEVEHQSYTAAPDKFQLEFHIFPNDPPAASN